MWDVERIARHRSAGVQQSKDNEKIYVALHTADGFFSFQARLTAVGGVGETCVGASPSAPSPRFGVVGDFTSGVLSDAHGL